jgi:hypothetical protein
MGQTTVLEGEVLHEGTRCRALFYGDQLYHAATLGYLFCLY